jgi:hypothetical protein
MAPSIDQLVEQAYKSIDAQSDYTLPRLEHWKKNNKHGIKKVSASILPVVNPAERKSKNY